MMNYERHAMLACMRLRGHSEAGKCVCQHLLPSMLAVDTGARDDVREEISKRLATLPPTLEASIRELLGIQSALPAAPTETV